MLSHRQYRWCTQLTLDRHWPYYSSLISIYYAIDAIRYINRRNNGTFKSQLDARQRKEQETVLCPTQFEKSGYSLKMETTLFSFQTFVFVLFLSLYVYTHIFFCFCFSKKLILDKALVNDFGVSFRSLQTEHHDVLKRFTWYLITRLSRYMYLIVL